MRRTQVTAWCFNFTDASKFKELPLIVTLKNIGRAYVNCILFHKDAYVCPFKPNIECGTAAHKRYLFLSVSKLSHFLFSSFFSSPHNVWSFLFCLLWGVKCWHSVYSLCFLCICLVLREFYYWPQVLGRDGGQERLKNTEGRNKI